MKSKRRHVLTTVLSIPSLKEGVLVSMVFYLLLCIPNNSNAQCFDQIASGDFFAFGLKSTGTIWGWGNNTLAGQLGNGTGVDLWVPTQITTSSNWKSVNCGSDYVLAIKTDGTLWGSGSNDFSQLGLGNGQPNLINTFTQIGTASNWKQMSGFNTSSFGIKTDGTLWGWGQNNGGQMGNNTYCSNQTTPLQIGTASDWKQVAASGSSSAFAIKNDGTLWGWGTNLSALLGNSSISVWNVPTQKDSNSDWDSIVLGYDHALALKSNGTLWGFGAWNDGETGQNPNNVLFPDVPIQIPGVWTKVVVGFRFSMGIKTDGTLWAWGKNNVGQLGDGTTTNRYIPYQISTATNWVSVSCGYQFTIALRSDGSLWSWGSNFYGELGNGTATTTQATPTAIAVPGCALDAPQFDATPSLTLAPIPVMDQLQLTYKGKESIESIVIYDLAGREVYTLVAMGTNAFSTSFSTAALSSGSYILVVKNKTQVVASKQFVKE